MVCGVDGLLASLLIGTGQNKRYTKTDRDAIGGFHVPIWLVFQPRVHKCAFCVALSVNDYGGPALIESLSEGTTNLLYEKYYRGLNKRVKPFGVRRCPGTIFLDSGNVR